MADTIQCLLDQGLTKQQIERYGLEGVEGDELDGRLTAARADMALRRRNARLQEVRMAEVVGQVQRYMEINPKANYQAALNAVLARDVMDRAGGISIEGIKQGIKGEVFAGLAEAAEALQPRRAGTKHNIALEDDIYRELHGVDTGNKTARTIATSVADKFEYLRTRKNAAGAAISRMENWGMPQRHVAEKLRNAGQDDWKSFVMERIDRDRMLNDEGQRLNDTELDELLDYVYETITTEGANKNRPPRGLRRTYAEYTPLNAAHRVLHFKDGEAGLQYQKKFGDSRVWQSIIDHIEFESGDIAAMEVMGPNANAGFERINQWAKVEDSKQQRSAGQFFAPSSEAIWKNLRGFGDSPHSRLAEATGTVRAALSSAQLGSATLASIPDVMTLALNANYNGLKFRNILKRINSLNDVEKRRVAAQTGGHIEWAIDQVAATARFEDITGGQRWRRLSDINYRISGMTAWTNGWQMAFHLEFMSELQRVLDKTGGDYSKLPKGIRRFVDTYGLKEDLQMMAGAEPIVQGGTRYFNPANMGNNKAISRVMGAVNNEQNMAILMPSAANRAAINRGLDPGTLMGETVRSAAQYKTYPVTLIMSMWGRYMFGSQLTSMDRVRYSAAMFVGMTMLGATAVQLKEIAKGKDMLDQDTPEFWTRAILQGGSLSLLGDLLLSGETRHGQGPLSYLMGPMGGFVSDIPGGVGAIAFNLLMGKDVDVAEEVGKLGERATYYIPLQSVWYTRHAFQRNVRDVFMESWDSTYENRQQDRERQMAKQTGQRYYWERGDSLPNLPTRAPEVAEDPDAPSLSAILFQ